MWVAGGLSLVAAALLYFLYAPAPPEPPLSARLELKTIRIGALERRYLVYAPARRAAGAPLIVVFHGSMGSPAKIRVETGYEFDRLADRHGFVVAYPAGHEGNWNDCRKAADYAARRLDIDDLGFFEAMVSQLQRQRGVDPERVFVAGLSSGGQFALRLALERPDRIAGAALFGASLPTPDNSVCAARPPSPPIMFVNGTSDPINPYEGGTVSMFGFASRGSVRSAIDSARHFAGTRTAAVPAIARLRPSGRGDGTWVERSVWRTPGRSEVVLLTVHGGGHVVPQPVYRPPRLLGRATTAINGPSEAWEFFRRQPRRPARLARAAAEPPRRD